MKNRKILIGISGSIAAYKSAYLIRLLIKKGCEVQVVMTEAAKDFITPQTISTLSRKPVFSTFVANENGQWNNHIDLALWADAIVIAPATAHTLAKCANGICNDLLTAVYLSARCPVLFAPAMDLDMYVHGSTLENLKKLESFGNQIVKSTFGDLASGLVGDGRMAEPEEIVENLEAIFGKIPNLAGKKILITAGPTQEPIDPVRFISNHSSGKMGFAIARRFCHAGASVKVVHGKLGFNASDYTKFEKIPVVSAHDMYTEVAKFIGEADIVIFAAAVADYTPAVVSDKKIKKKETNFSINLIKTVDLAATFGKGKRKNQIFVGFALETDNELENAKDKLKRKNFDMIVLNSLNDTGAGFGFDTNRVTIVEADGIVREFEIKSKDEVADDIVNLISLKLA